MTILGQWSLRVVVQCAPLSIKQFDLIHYLKKKKFIGWKNFQMTRGRAGGAEEKEGLEEKEEGEG